MSKIEVLITVAESLIGGEKDVYFYAPFVGCKPFDMIEYLENATGEEVCLDAGPSSFQYIAYYKKGTKELHG